MSEAPNILWICTDQQRYDTLGALGNSHIRTPHVDRLVAEGTTFTHATCQSPICTPSRASFLTGMYPTSVHGCMNGNDRWAEAAPLVTKLLRDGAGYDCGLSGKLHLAGAHGRIEPRPKDDGYRVFHWSHDPRDQWPAGHAYKDWLADRGHDLGTLRENPTAIPPELHQTAFCTDKAIEFLSEDRDGPWLMSVNVFDPHAPFDPPQEYLDRYEPDSVPGPLFRDSDLAAQERLTGTDFQNRCRRPEDFGAKGVIAAYYAMIELIDHNVGRMLEALEATGQRATTLVVFMSDHGEMLGDHGLLLKGCRFYEGLVRVPLVLSWPGTIPAGRRSGALVELTDLAPTFMDYAGLEIPKRMQGRSLRPVIEGRTEAHREVVRCEYFHALNPENNPGLSGTLATMVRDDRHKLCVYHGHPVGELFDLQEDPGEFENLWDSAEHRDVRFELMKRSFDLLAEAADRGPEATCRF